MLPKKGGGDLDLAKPNKRARAAHHPLRSCVTSRDYLLLTNPIDHLAEPRQQRRRHQLHRARDEGTARGLERGLHVPLGVHLLNHFVFLASRKKIKK